MRLVKRIAIISFALFVLAPSSATAQNFAPPSEQSLRKQGILFVVDPKLVNLGGGVYNGGVSTCVGLDAPTITNQAALATMIDAYIAEMNPESPMKGLGKDFVEGSVRAKFNPLLLVAQARKESNFGAPIPDSVAAIPGGYNAFGRKAAPDQPQIDGWFQYPSWAKSVNNPADTENGDQPLYAKSWLVDTLGNNTLDKYLNVYAPPVENDTSQYAKDVRAWMADMVSRAGSALSCGGGASDEVGAKIVAAAVSQLGNVESSTNCGDSILKYFDYSGVGCGQAWCAYFITWAYGQAGLQIESSNNGYVPAVGVWFLENKFFFYKSDPYTPKPGDIYIKVNSGSSNVPMTMDYGDHIGIVERVEGNVLYTIDGNYSDSVARREFVNWSAPDSPIIGFGRFVDKNTVQPDGGGQSNGSGGNGGAGSEL